MTSPSRAAAVLLLPMLVALSLPAYAQPRWHAGKTTRSPQTLALELRFSPFRPDIDSEPGLVGKPYESTFGTMPRLMIAGEVDWQAFRIPHLGTVGPGVGVGYTNMSERAYLKRCIAKLANDKPKSTCESGDETSLDIWQTYMVAVVRFDALWHDFRVPIVPYVKAGLGLGFWQASTTGGLSISKTASGPVEGRGYTFGTHLAAGAALALDWLDPHSSVTLDQSVGINSSYVFFEYYMSNLNGLGQSEALRVGATTWAVGLAFEL